MFGSQLFDSVRACIAHTHAPHTGYHMHTHTCIAPPFGFRPKDSGLTKSCTGLETRLSRCPHRFNIDKGKSNGDNIHRPKLRIHIRRCLHGDNIHRPKIRIRIRRCLPNNIESGGVGRGQLGIGLVLPGGRARFVFKQCRFKKWTFLISQTGQPFIPGI